MPDQRIEYYAIEPKDFTYIRSLKSRLFSQERMTADQMRDFANRLQLIIDNAIPLGLDDDNNPFEIQKPTVA
jgi:hypothetical protein